MITIMFGRFHVEPDRIRLSSVEFSRVWPLSVKPRGVRLLPVEPGGVRPVQVGTGGGSARESESESELELSDTVVELCRLTVRAPGTVFELAVPVDVPVAELLPVFADLAGGGLHEEGLLHGGWSLQRLGGPPLDEEGTAHSLELRDGEVLHLRARDESLPEAAFDDLVDGVSESLRARSDSWDPALARVALLGGAVAALAAGFVALALPGSATVRGTVAACLAVLLILCAAAVSRAVGDAGGGGALGVTAVPYLALAAALIPEGGSPHAVLGARLLSAGAAGTGAAVLALAAVAACGPLFLGALCLALALGGGGVLVLAGLDLPEAAGVTGLVAVVLGGIAPNLASRLAGLRLPDLPNDAAQLQEGIEPHPTAAVALRAERADRLLTALLAAFALVTAASATAVLTGPGDGGDGWPAPVFALLLGVLLLLHARRIGNRWQRLAVVTAGGYVPLLVAFLAAAHGTLAVRLEVIAGLTVVAAVAAVSAWTVPGRRLVPYWGRAGDLVQTAAAVALVPLAVLIAGGYGYLRHLGG